MPGREVCKFLPTTMPLSTRSPADWARAVSGSIPIPAITHPASNFLPPLVSSFHAAFLGFETGRFIFRDKGNSLLFVEIRHKSRKVGGKYIFQQVFSGKEQGDFFTDGKAPPPVRRR